MNHLTRLSLGMLAVAALPAVAAAQKTTQPTTRRQAPIEIRGQVPTPQVVTVRPREVPAFQRQVLVPRFFDHDFWPDIQAPYQVVPERQIDGSLVSDTLGTGATTPATNAAPSTTAAPASTAAPDNTATPASTPAANNNTTPTTTPTTPSTTPSTTPPVAAPSPSASRTGTAPAPATKP